MGVNSLVISVVESTVLFDYHLTVFQHVRKVHFGRLLDASVINIGQQIEVAKTDRK